MVARTARKQQQWRRKASEKNAIVPAYFEVSAVNAVMKCGRCGEVFRRNLIAGMDGPVFSCPRKSCKARNWLPVTFASGLGSL